MWERAQLSFIILPRFSPFFAGFMSEIGREMNRGWGDILLLIEQLFLFRVTGLSVTGWLVGWRATGTK